MKFKNFLFYFIFFIFLFSCSKPQKNITIASGGTGGGRVSVAAAQEDLTTAISARGQEPDAAIIGKLTGKAAKYFAELLNKLND